MLFINPRKATWASVTVHLIIGLTATLAFSGIIIVLTVVYTVLSSKDDEFKITKRGSKSTLTVNDAAFIRNIDD